MNTETIFDRFAHEQGWDMDSQVTILLRYIANQQSDEAFKDFLREQQDEEDEEPADYGDGLDRDGNPIK